MRKVAVRKTGEGRPLAQSAGLADSFWQRARGLLGRPPLAEGEGLLVTVIDSTPNTVWLIFGVAFEEYTL